MLLKSLENHYDIEGMIINRSGSGIVIGIEITDLHKAIESFLDMMEDGDHCDNYRFGSNCSLCMDLVRNTVRNDPDNYILIKKQLVPFISCRNALKETNLKIIINAIFAHRPKDKEQNSKL